MKRRPKTSAAVERKRDGEQRPPTKTAGPYDAAPLNVRTLMIGYTLHMSVALVCGLFVALVPAHTPAWAAVLVAWSSLHIVIEGGLGMSFASIHVQTRWSAAVGFLHHVCAVIGVVYSVTQMFTWQVVDEKTWGSIVTHGVFAVDVVRVLLLAAVYRPLIPHRQTSVYVLTVRWEIPAVLCLAVLGLSCATAAHSFVVDMHVVHIVFGAFVALLNAVACVYVFVRRSGPFIVL